MHGQVQLGDAHRQDWRDASAYSALLEADRSLVAWEWLRRDPGYRDAAERRLAAGPGASPTGPDPKQWGLCAFEPPGLAIPAARPLWRADVSPYVLVADGAGGATGSDAFDLAAVEGRARVVGTGDRRQCLLLSDGLRAIRLDVLNGGIGERPVRLRYRLAGLRSAEPPLLTLRRFLALCRTGRFSAVLHRPEARAKRWVMLLRAHDAVAAGANQREIAAFLLSRCADSARWRTDAPSLRSQAQRLVRGARAMADGGYRNLLR